MDARLRGCIAAFLGAFLSAAMLLATPAAPQRGPADVDFRDALRWRPLGPDSPGRVTVLQGDPERFGVFYVGVAGAGLWKTTDFGASWDPILEAAPSGNVTAVALARGAPGVVYAAVDAADAAPRLVRSTDAGATWAPVVVADTGEVTGLAIAASPAAPLRLFVSLARDGSDGGTHDTLMSTDGGRSFVRVARVRGHAALSRVFADPFQSAVVLALDSIDGAAPSLRRSIDGGATWLPTDDTRTLPIFNARLHHVDIAAGADGRLFLLAASDDGLELFASTNAAQTWSRVTTVFPPSSDAANAPRLGVTSSGRLLIARGAVLESTDKGETFAFLPGIPIGRHDDLVWTHPTMPGVLMLGGASGAIVTVNEGRSWSRPDVLPAAAVDRLSVDAAFPYRVCADERGQVSCTEAWPESTSARRWNSLPRRVSGPILADPQDVEVVLGGDLVRYDRRTGQSQEISPSGVSTSPDAPVAKAFSADGRTLYVAGARIWRTSNGGDEWADISPPTLHTSASDVTPRVSALTVSPIDTRTLWAGLDDGRVLVTRDGGVRWEERITPVGAGVAIRGIEPSRFDTSSAYAVLADDGQGAHGAQLLRTRDLGVTWVNVGRDIPQVNRVNVVREDPFRRGLLFAGTDRSVFVSFDDGGGWQPIGLNLPASPVTDLALKDADLLAATAGRGVWLLEDVTPLRQITPDVARASAFLFRPPQAWRVRSGEPTTAGAGRGATFTYLLSDAVTESITLDVVDTTTGDLIRRFTSQPGDGPSDGGDGQSGLATTPGLHRVTWDLRYAPPPTRPGGASVSPGTATLPGTYQVRLTIDGRNLRQAVTVRLDPRVRTSILDLTSQRDLGRAVDAARTAVHGALWPPSANTGTELPLVRRRRLESLATELNSLAAILQQADSRPGARVERAVEAAVARAAAVLSGDED